MEYQKFSLAVIGGGRWGINHIRTAYHLFKGAFKGVCDLKPESAEKVKAIAPEIPFTNDIQAILQDPEITAVVIATPAETHYSLTRQCLHAGKHVLVEKPITLFSFQGRELQKLAQEKKLTLMVGHLLLYHPAIRKIKELINNGTVGKLQYIYSNRLNLGAIRKEENILWSFAPHDISVIQYLVEDDPVDIDAKGSIFLQPGIHDVTLTMLRYPKNISAHIHVSWLHPFKEHRLVIIGDKSMAVFEDSRKDNKLVLYPKGFDWVNGEPRKREGEYQIVSYQNEEPLKLELAHFAQCVEKGVRPLTDGENGVRVLEILEKAQTKLEGTESPAIVSSSTSSQTDFFVHETAVVDEGSQIGANSKVWHFSHVQKGAKIGRNCTLGQNVNIGNNVRMGNYVKIQNNVSVYEGVELEDYVFCGPSMVFTNIHTPRCEFPQRGSEYYQKTLVKRGASIGANATILCGVTIGCCALIGAGAMVTKDIPDFALVVGNPARIVGWVSRAGVKLSFENGVAYCERSKKYYRKTGEKSVEELETLD